MRNSTVKWTFEIKKFIQTSSKNLSQTNRLLLQMKVDTETKKSISFGNIVLHKAVFLTLFCLIQCLVRGHDKDN